MSEAAVLEAPIPVTNPVPPAAATAVVPPPSETPPKPAKLVRPRDEAVVHIQTQLQRGVDLKSLRIRNPQELDQARSAKLEWTNQTTQLLTDLFDSNSIADQCNDWVGRIFPEYAEFGNFVEQFYAEMDHRLGRLKTVLKRIERMRLAAKPGTQTGTTANQAQASDGNANLAVAGTVVPAATVIEPPKLQDDLAGLLVVRKVEAPWRQAVAEFLESLDIDVSIAEEPQDMSDLLDRHRQVQFAVVLSGQEGTERNFELGFCAGKLGIQRVILLNVQPAANPPPQLLAAEQAQAGQLPTLSRTLTTIPVDSAGGWQLLLARQLKRSGLGVDLNRLC